MTTPTPTPAVAELRAKLTQVRLRVLEELAFAQATRQEGEACRQLIRTWPECPYTRDARADVDEGIQELTGSVNRLLDELAQVNRDIHELDGARPEGPDSRGPGGHPERHPAGPDDHA